MPNYQTVATQIIVVCLFLGVYTVGGWCIGDTSHAIACCCDTSHVTNQALLPHYTCRIDSNMCVSVHMYLAMHMAHMCCSVCGCRRAVACLNTLMNGSQSLYISRESSIEFAHTPLHTYIYICCCGLRCTVTKHAIVWVWWPAGMWSNTAKHVPTLQHACQIPCDPTLWLGVPIWCVRDLQFDEAAAVVGNYSARPAKPVCWDA